MELKLILTMFRRWSWLLVIGLIVGGGAGYVLSLYQTPEYLASTKVMVMEPLGNNVSNVNDLNDKELADTYMELLLTQPILESVSQKVGQTVRASTIKAVRVRDTGLLEVTVRDTNPEQAALIANTLVAVLIEYNEALQMSRFSSSEQSLELQVNEIESELGQLEQNIEQRSEQNSEAKQLATEQRKVELEQQIFTLQGEIARLEQDIDDLTPDVLPNQLPTPLTPEQREQLNDRRTQLAQKQFVLDLAKESYFKLVLPEETAALTEPAATQNLEQANLELYRQLYSTLLSNYEAVRLARLQNTPNVVQVEKATPPPLPIQPGPLRNIILGALIGLLVTGAIAFTLEYLDDTLKTPQDIANVLGLPVVGYVANEAAVEKSEGMPYVAANPRSPMAETFRTLRTNLEFASVDKPLKTILITSPGSSEGKTTIASNLAAVIAQANKRVILLEGDLRRPRVHRALGMTNQVGLSDVFRGQMDIRDVARYSKVKDLAVITSGSLPPNPAELLGSARMSHILARLVESASVVVIDSPPFVVTDATVLAAKVDGVLLVIQPGKTHAEAARALLAQLNRAGAHVVGVVLNRVPRKSANYYGYYRYDSDSPAYSVETQPAETSPAANGRAKGIALFSNGKAVNGRIGEETSS
ncbi:polysaccharide biosynthesis tyrosine autokinase [Promineifilum sp.]|uniref:polysaccharide biosynthesis tyrosine autokinase n=1 Tax=Promineifilum sp. TaxID=2664178 RepID=UPI0035B47C65